MRKNRDTVNNHTQLNAFKDTLKGFSDFRNKQKSVWCNVFWYVKVCIFWKCFEYTLHWDSTQPLKKFPLDKINQGRSQNLKQVLQNFMKTFNVEDVALTSHLMTSYRKSNVASETMINDIVTSPSNRHWKKLEFGYNIFFSLSKVSQLNIYIT